MQSALNANIYYTADKHAGQTNTDKGKTIPDGQPIKIAFSIEGLSHPYLIAQANQAVAEGKKLGAQVTVISANDDPNKQLSDIEDTLQKGTNALLMMPAVTSGLSNALKQYTAKGVPYFYTCKGQENVQAASQALCGYSGEGALLGKYVVSHYANTKSTIKVGIIDGIPGDLSSVARVDQFQARTRQGGSL